MVKLSILDVATLTILFIAAFWLWTVPIRNNPLPFGEHDGAYIFSHGDYMTYTGKTPWLTGDYPVSILFWYSCWNPVLGPMALEYPPPYLMDYSYAQIFGRERIVPVYIFIAISCFLGVFSMYLLMRNLYGYEAALISAAGAMFSFRAISLYLWGQRHQMTSFAFIPIAVYALYKYLKSFYQDDEKIIYLYLFVILSLCTYLVHMGASVFLVPFTAAFVLLMSVKHKRFPFSKKSLIHYFIIAAISILIIAPFYLIYFGPTATPEMDPGFKDLGSLFVWLKVPENKYDMNPAFTDYNTSYMGRWSIILIIIGVAALLVRRNDEDMALISCFFGLYAIFHMPAFGLIGEGSYRVGRFLVVESYFFFALIAVGIVYLPRFLPVNKSWKRYSRYILTGIFLLLAVFLQGRTAYSYLNTAYPSISRITPAQNRLAEWIEQNVPESSAVHYMGTLTYPKMAFIQILSRRVGYRTDDSPEKRDIVACDGQLKPGHILPDVFRRGDNMSIRIDYIVFDYSDLALLANQPQFQAKIDSLRDTEQRMSESLSLVYEQDNIRVYKFE